MDLEEKNDIVSTIKRDIQKWCTRWLVFVFGSFSIFGLFGIYQAYVLAIQKTGETITSEITEKFSEDRISETFNNVAENQAKQIINQNLEPAIVSATDSINSNLQKLDAKIEKANTEYDLELKSLQREVAFFKERTNILKQGDLAIATGLAEPFDNLIRIFKSSKSDDLKITAMAEINRILVHLASFPFVTGDTISFTRNGTNKRIPLNTMRTSKLVKDLQDSKLPYIFRAIAANILSMRKEKGVISILITTAENDSNLLVRRNALNSFKKLTGFTNHMSEISNRGFVKNDLFNIGFAKRVFQNNKDKWEAKFTEMK